MMFRCIIAAQHISTSLDYGVHSVVCSVVRSVVQIEVVRALSISILYEFSEILQCSTTEPF